MYSNPIHFLKYVPALDGLRAFAVTSVLVFHAMTLVPPLPKWIYWGGHGVDVFFVLSGYLITGTLLKEFEATGCILLVQFYWRRFLRLFPALALCCATLLAIDALGFCLGCDIPRAAAASLLYVMNWVRLLTAFNGELMQHGWTLAIEEQFYLLWAPMLLGILVLSTRLRMGADWIIGMVFVAATLWHLAVFRGGNDFLRTDLWFYQLLFGAFLSALMATPYRQPLIRCGRILGFPALCALIFAAFRIVTIPLEPMFTAVCAAILILACHSSSLLARTFASAPFVWIGKHSYGIYIWHFPINMLLWHWGYVAGNPLIGITGATAATIIIAALSYRFVEQPLLRLRYRPLLRPSDALQASVRPRRAPSSRL